MNRAEYIVLVLTLLIYCWTRLSSLCLVGTYIAMEINIYKGITNSFTKSILYIRLILAAYVLLLFLNEDGITDISWSILLSPLFLVLVVIVIGFFIMVFSKIQRKDMSFILQRNKNLYLAFWLLISL